QAHPPELVHKEGVGLIVEARYPHRVSAEPADDRFPARTGRDETINGSLGKSGRHLGSRDLDGGRAISLQHSARCPSSRYPNALSLQIPRGAGIQVAEDEEGVAGAHEIEQPQTPNLK